MESKEKTIVVSIEFEIKQVVYLRTDMEQLPRLVSDIIVGDKEVHYGLKQGTNYEIHQAFEIVTEKIVM
ncbi:hypothetical protein [Myroides odoratus]|uniref:hypothetical protein n=1 Tax=Myroides odoratus TaxID=256 RepID=UPI00333E4919